MVIYEVNLEVATEIYPAYYAWLCEHAQEIVNLSGFIQAKVLEPLDLTGTVKSATDFKQVTALYLLADEQALQDYLTHHAPRLRQAGLDKFGNKFTATRRMFAVNAVYDREGE